MRKHEIGSAIELVFLDESILLLGAHEREQIDKWLAHVQKAKKFVEWYNSVASVLGSQQNLTTVDEVLSDQLVYKLQQIVDFCQS